MPKIQKSIFINAPVEKVFEFMAQPENMPEIWPSFQEVKDPKEMPDGGYSYNWVYKMAGMRFTGATETTEFKQNQRVVEKNTGGIPSNFVWTYAAENGGTRLTVEVDYSIPGALLGKLAEPFITRQNEHEADTVLANLKARMET